MSLEQFGWVPFGSSVHPATGKHQSLKLKGCHFDKILSLTVPEVVVQMATSCATSDTNIISALTVFLSDDQLEINVGQLGFNDLKDLIQDNTISLETNVGLEINYSLRWRHNELDGVSDHQAHDCLLNRLFGRTSKKTSKLCVTGLCAGNSPGTGEFPAQMASNAENVSIWWRYHVPQ